MLFEVPPGERFGPWSRRPWRPVEVANEQIPYSDIIMKVKVTEGVLTTDSLDGLAHKGVNVHTGGKEKLFPAREALRE